MIEKLRQIVDKPMVEQSLSDELIGLLIIVVALGIIYLIGTVVYKLEEHTKGGKK